MAPRPLALLLALLSASLSAEVRDLKAFFQQRCASCHGPDGSGRGPGGALGGSNLLDSRRLVGQEAADLAGIILQGRGAMPGFRRQLSQEEALKLARDILRRVGKGRTAQAG